MPISPCRMSVFLPARLFVATVLAGVTLACSTPPPPADLLVYGRVWTGDTTRPWAEAVATRGDTIVAVGGRGELDRFRGPNTRVMDNGGALVTPGFMDNHTHFLDGGFQLASVDLRDADSPEEFTRRIKAFASERQPGEWIQGGDWDHERWPGTPLPRKEWVDSVTPNNPVFVSRLDGHMGVANSLALKAGGISRNTKPIPGGTIVRDPVTGWPTGLLKDEAMNPVYAAMPAPTDPQEDAALTRATQYALSKGVTAVGFVSAPWIQVAALVRAHQAGSLGLRVSVYPSVSDWRRVADSVTRNGPGDDWLRLDGVKGYMDGSLGSTTALFFEPYADDPTTSGLETTNRDSVAAWIGAADSAGLQVVIHAIGEKANAVLLDIYDSVAKAHGTRDRRFRIEHAQHLRPREVERMAEQGVIASMQPYHVIDDGRWAGKRLGPRVVNSYVFRSVLDHGAHLTFGSDWTVAPIDPILGIYAAVTRRTLDDKNPGGWIPEQKITLEEALRAYTSANAYGVFAEATRGVIKPGYRADLTLLEKDLFAIPPEEIANVQIRATIVGGKVGYESSP
jgi:predicted amidohydrolase YtcJ